MSSTRFSNWSIRWPWVLSWWPCVCTSRAKPARVTPRRTTPPAIAFQGTLHSKPASPACSSKLLPFELDSARCTTRDAWGRRSMLLWETMRESIALGDHAVVCGESFECVRTDGGGALRISLPVDVSKRSTFLPLTSPP